MKCSIDNFTFQLHVEVIFQMYKAVYILLQLISSLSLSNLKSHVGDFKKLMEKWKERKDYVSSMYSCVSLDALEPCLMASVCSSRSVSVGQSCSRITKRHTLPASLKGFHTWLTHPQPSLALQNESTQKGTGNTESTGNWEDGDQHWVNARRNTRS